MANEQQAEIRLQGRAYKNVVETAGTFNRWEWWIRTSSENPCMAFFSILSFDTKEDAIKDMQAFVKDIAKTLRSTKVTDMKTGSIVSL